MRKPQEGRQQCNVAYVLLWSCSTRKFLNVNIHSCFQEKMATRERRAEIYPRNFGSAIYTAVQKMQAQGGEVYIRRIIQAILGVLSVRIQEGRHGLLVHRSTAVVISTMTFPSFARKFRSGHPYRKMNASTRRRSLRTSYKLFSGFFHSVYKRDAMTYYLFTAVLMWLR